MHLHNLKMFRRAYLRGGGGSERLTSNVIDASRLSTAMQKSATRPPWPASIHGCANTTDAIAEANKSAKRNKQRTFGHFSCPPSIYRYVFPSFFPFLFSLHLHFRRPFALVTLTILNVKTICRCHCHLIDTSGHFSSSSPALSSIGRAAASSLCTAPTGRCKT